MSGDNLHENSQAYSADNDEFGKVLPKSPYILKELPSRICIHGKYYKLNARNEYSKYIYQAIIKSLSTEWFRSLNKFSQRSIFTNLKFFINWLNDQEIIKEDKFKILKNYESFRVNENKVKPQSTGLNSIITLIKNSTSEIEYETNLEFFEYIDGLLTRTNISKFDPPIPETLTIFFSSIPWLKNAIGNENFLKLESPKRVINSFSITVSTILLHIIKIKREAKKELIDLEFINEDTSYSERSKGQIYCGTLFSKLSKFNENLKPANEITELLILDFVPDAKIEKLAKLCIDKLISPQIKYKLNICGRYTFTKPNIFSIHAWESPSELEQLLFAWLCAWQTVQPYDVFKLKKNDFIISKNNEGRIVSVQCRYYKGRSERIYEPPMLDSRQIEGKAIIEYLNYFSENTTNLISDIQISRVNLSFGTSSTSERLANLINHPRILEELMANLWKRNASPIFINCYNALYEKREFAFSKWMNKLKRKLTQNSGFSTDLYKASSKYALPLMLFGLNAIKNSSVHANTDKYRDKDLINQNSHTSTTEKISYLTDANKEWVNQNGRITRLVMHDIEHLVYKPNLDYASSKAYELSLRTKVVHLFSDSQSKDEKLMINSLGQVNFSKETYLKYEADADAILVLDTEETVVNMAHYINEAESQQSLLLNNAIEFYEKTVLPNVEWMEFLLTSKLSPSIVKRGYKNFNEIKGILPRLFSNEIAGSLGS